jgi:UDP-N-acetylglucosamine--N-acetylmuramyl-(pentapeptide) pyrophosphoryl-undecaprenol N-acetylglucosamine transferase
MPAALAAADLVIGRAGAGAVAEICAVGRPSLLVPYPFAGDHQKLNADSITREGAALWVPSAEATPVRLATELRSLMDQPERLASMAATARRLGRPHAAQAIAKDLLSLAGVDLARTDGSAPSTPSPLDRLTPDPRPLTPEADNRFVKLTEVA